MATRARVLMKFKTSLGKQKVIAINNPRPSVTASNITTSRNNFLSSNPFDASIGSLSSFIEAVRVTETTEKLI